jgi:hypothetical protein
MKFISPCAKKAMIGWISLHFFSFMIVLVEMKKWRNKKLEGKL